VDNPDVTIIEAVETEDRILNSLILVPQYDNVVEPEIQLLNDSTHFWLWGDMETEAYLDIVNDTLGDVNGHLDRMELALRYSYA
jgi:hypothetical protein